MFNLNSHGGHCCGINHMRTFNLYGETNEALDLLKRKIAEYKPRGGRQRTFLLEVVVTDQQIRALPRQMAVLKQEGFELVSRFINPNSGNVCNVLHLRNHKVTSRSPWNKVKVD